MNIFIRQFLSTYNTHIKVLYGYKLSYKYIHYYILTFSAAENGLFTHKPIQHVY